MAARGFFHERDGLSSALRMEDKLYRRSKAVLRQLM